MTYTDAVNNLLVSYSKYGIDRAEIEKIINDGIQNYGLSVNACYNGFRMALGSTLGEHEYFSVEDLMEITGESRQEAVERIEQMKQELIEQGEKLDDYFTEIEPQERKVFYFPNGIRK
jgi:hypothetical protein